MTKKTRKKPRRKPDCVYPVRSIIRNEVSFIVFQFWAKEMVWSWKGLSTTFDFDAIATANNGCLPLSPGKAFLLAYREWMDKTAEKYLLRDKND